MIDIHTHILPGLDDGPEHLDESIKMCKMAYADGVRTIVATPHMNDGMYNVKVSQVAEGVERLADALASEGVMMKILPGGDISLTPETLPKLESGDLACVAFNGKYAMIELPSDVVPSNIHEVIFELQTAGYSLIISHIERNLAVQRNLGIARKIASWDTLMQVTAASIVGDFGRETQKCAQELIEQRLGHVVASDMHRINKRPPGRMTRAREMVSEIMTPQEVDEMFEERPRSIITGESVVIPEPLKKAKRSWWKIWGNA